MAGDLCFPDETLALTGDRLSGARLRVWAEGRLADVEPLRGADDRMLAVMPKSLPRSTMLVWPVRGTAAGAPIRVNGATVWWSWPTRAPSQTPGQIIRLIGKGFQLPGWKPQVDLAPAATGDGDEGRWLTVNSANPYHLEAALPPDLPSGVYRVWYSIGDVARGNHGRDADVAVYLHTRFGDRRMPRAYPPHPDGGIMLGVIENNDFQEVQEGIVVSTPANWSLLRNNRMAITPAGSSPAFDETWETAVDPTFCLRVEPADRSEPER
jgi:hypothetical protein